MLHELVAHLLVEVGALVAELRQVAEGSLHEVEPVDVILYPDIKRRGDGAFLLVSADVDQAVVVTAVGQLVNQAGIAVEIKDDRLVLREEHVILLVREAVRMLAVRLELEEVHDIDEADFDIRQLSVQNAHGRQRFQCRSLTGAGKHDIRILSLVVRRPFPDADALGAVAYRLGH